MNTSLEFKHLQDELDLANNEVFHLRQQVKHLKEHNIHLIEETEANTAYVNYLFPKPTRTIVKEHVMHKVYSLYDRVVRSDALNIPRFLWRSRPRVSIKCGWAKD